MRRAPGRRDGAGCAVRLLGRLRAAAGHAVRRAAGLREELVQREGTAASASEGGVRACATGSRPVRDRVRRRVSERVSGEEFFEALEGRPAGRDGDRRGGARSPPAPRATPVRPRRRSVGRRSPPSSRPGAGCSVLVADVARVGRCSHATFISRGSAVRTCICTMPARRPGSASAVCGDGAVDEPDVVMADIVAAAANPELVGAFDHVAFVDPPFDGGLFAESCWRWPRRPASRRSGARVR